MKKKIISKHTFKNGANVFIINNKLSDYDLIIKFNNYGSNLDKYHNIYGLQHLLEHAIFHYNKNLNIDFNGSTSPSFMCLELNLDNYKKNNDSLNLLKSWLFTNNDYTKIDISRKLSFDEISCYINELESEYLYRNLINIPWDLQTLLLTGGIIHYFGGNKNTFRNKEKEIQKYLLSPYPINPEDITIFLKESKEGFLPNIKLLFNELVPIKKSKTNLQYEPEKFFNKIIQINNGNTNTLSFLLFKNDIKDISLLYYIKLLYPFFSFEINNLDYYYLNFSFKRGNQLFDFFNVLKNLEYEKLSLEDYDFYITNYIDLLNIDKCPEKIIDLYNDLHNNIYEVKKLYKEHKDDIIYFFKLLSKKINDKLFFINLTKSFFYNNNTVFGENMNIVDIHHIDSTYFLNNIFSNFELRFLYNEKFKSKEMINCFPSMNIIKKVNDCYNFFPKDLFYNNNNHYNKMNLFTYYNSLIYFFISPIHNSFENYIKMVLEKNNYLFMVKENSVNIKLSNKHYHINTEFNFIFCVIKTNIKDSKSIFYLKNNLEEKLKRNGLCYYLNATTLLFDKFSLSFFCTNTSSSNFKGIINLIKNTFYSIGMKKINMDVVSSTINNKIDLSSLKKRITYNI